MTPTKRTRPAPERLAYSVEEAGQVCGVSAQTVRRWLASDELVGTRIGSRTYILADDLRAFLGAHRETA